MRDALFSDLQARVSSHRSFLHKRLSLEHCQEFSSRIEFDWFKKNNESDQNKTTGTWLRRLSFILAHIIQLEAGCFRISNNYFPGLLSSRVLVKGKEASNFYFKNSWIQVVNVI